MREVELPLTQERLADALGELRKWLDHHECVPLSFDITRETGVGLVIRMVLKEDELADAFERAFKEATN